MFGRSKQEKIEKNIKKSEEAAKEGKFFSSERYINKAEELDRQEKIRLLRNMRKKMNRIKQAQSSRNTAPKVSRYMDNDVSMNSRVR